MKKRKEIKEKKTVAEIKANSTILTEVEKNLLYGLAKGVTEEEFIVEISGCHKELHELPDNRWLPGSDNQVRSLEVHPEEAVNGSVAKSTGGFVFNNAINQKNMIKYRNVNSNHAYKKWNAKKKIGLLCISAINGYEEARGAILGWKDYLSPKAKVVVLCSNKSGLDQVIGECTGDTGNFLLEKTAGTLKVMRLDNCTHYWLIDTAEIGICRKCGRKRNFRKLMRRITATENRRGKVKTNFP